MDNPILPAELLMKVASYTEPTINICLTSKIFKNERVPVTKTKLCPPELQMWLVQEAQRERNLYILRKVALSCLYHGVIIHEGFLSDLIENGTSIFWELDLFRAVVTGNKPASIEWFLTYCDDILQSNIGLTDALEAGCQPVAIKLCEYEIERFPDEQQFYSYSWNNLFNEVITMSALGNMKNLDVINYLINRVSTGWDFSTTDLAMDPRWIALKYLIEMNGPFQECFDIVRKTINENHPDPDAWNQIINYLAWTAFYKIRHGILEVMITKDSFQFKKMYFLHAYARTDIPTIRFILNHAEKFAKDTTNEQTVMKRDWYYNRSVMKQMISEHENKDYIFQVFDERYF